MKRRNFIQVASALSLGALAGAGCGGGKNALAPSTGGASSKATGRVEMRLRWPEAPAETAAASRVIPQASRSVRVRLLQNATIAGQQILPRDPSVPTATFVFDNLPVGDYTMLSEAFPTTGGEGTVLAQAQISVTVSDGQVSTVRLTMASTVASLQITAPSILFVGDTATLPVTARDASNTVILLGAGALRYESSNPNVLTVDNTGAIKAVGQGTVTVVATDTESGNTAQVTFDIALPGPKVPVPMALYDAAHTSRALYSSKATGVTKWKFSLPARTTANGAPVVGADGTVYFAAATRTSSGGYDYFLYAIDGQTGITKWKTDVQSLANGAFNINTPAIGDDGTLYCGTDGSLFFAIDGQTGAKKWQYDAGRSVYSVPLIDKNGTLYVAVGNNGLALNETHYLALNSATGSRIWEATIDEQGGAPTLGPDGTLYCTADTPQTGAAVYALNSTNGTRKWRAVFDKNFAGRLPSVADDGTVYISVRFQVSSFDTAGLYALNGATGSVKWFFKVDDATQPSIGKDGKLYVSSTDGNVISLNSSGKQLWTFKTNSPFRFPSPVLSPDGTAYVGDDTGVFYALDSVTGTEKWRFSGESEGFKQQCAIGKDGTLYVLYPSGTLYALR